MKIGDPSKHRTWSSARHPLVFGKGFKGDTANEPLLSREYGGGCRGRDVRTWAWVGLGVVVVVEVVVSIVVGWAVKIVESKFLQFGGCNSAKFKRMKVAKIKKNLYCVFKGKRCLLFFIIK